MSVLIFKLNDVSDEEADDVRDLLEENSIDFYETSAGRWGVSVAGIWVKDKEKFVVARKLIDEYQLQRIERLGSITIKESLWGRFKAAPMQLLAMLVIVALVLYVSIVPFVSL